MAATGDRSGFFARAYAEAEPVLVHICVAVLLETSLLAIGVIAWVMKMLFPQHHEHLERMVLVDIWTALAVLVLFACHTLLKVSIRLTASIVSEIRAHS